MTLTYLFKGQNLTLKNVNKGHDRHMLYKDRHSDTQSSNQIRDSHSLNFMETQLSVINNVFKPCEGERQDSGRLPILEGLY